MKASYLIICITALLFTACDKRANDPGTEKRDPDNPGSDQPGFILTTDLPEAQFCGTPKPIRLPRHTPGYNG